MSPATRPSSASKTNSSAKGSKGQLQKDLGDKTKTVRKNKTPRSGAGKRKRKGRGGLAGRLFRVGLVLICCGIFMSGWLFWRITQYEPLNPVPQREAAIVLGAALWNNKPSPGLRERLDQALKLYREGRVDKLIVSGGLDRNGSTLTEAQGMRIYLVAKGVPQENIFLENRATSTYENLVYSRAVAKQRGINSYLIVTHEYHAARALDMARFIGYEDPAVSSVKSKVLNAARNQTRETLAFGKWQLDKLLMLTGVKSVNMAYLSRIHL